MLIEVLVISEFQLIYMIFLLLYGYYGMIILYNSKIGLIKRFYVNIFIEEKCD